MNDKKNKSKTASKPEKSIDRHSIDIPSEQDRPWVDESQFPQKQFDKVEYEEEQEKAEKKKKSRP